jgi:hypothetical protein
MLKFSRVYDHRQTGITTDNIPFGTGTALANAVVVGIMMRDRGTVKRGGANAQIVPAEIFDGLFLHLECMSQAGGKSGIIGDIPCRLIANATNIHGYFSINDAILDLNACAIISNAAHAGSVEIIFLLK